MAREVARARAQEPMLQQLLTQDPTPLNEAVRGVRFSPALEQAIMPVIDSMVNKGIVTRNKAARHKSRLNAQVRALSA